MPDHLVEAAFPGSQNWCDATHEALTDYYAKMSADPTAGEMLSIVPAVAVGEPEDHDEPWELCLTWVQVPAEGAWSAAQWAMSVVQTIAPDLASHPGLRVVAACAGSETPDTAA